MASDAPPLEVDEDTATENVILLNRYRVEKSLGEGSYGKVKLVVDLRTGDKVAMKIIHKSCIKKPVHITRLKREVRIMKLLHHPHIVKLFEVAETDKEIILVMEYMNGGELFDYIVAQKRVKDKIARKFFRQILSAVDYCHQSSIIHRDLKPENLLLDENHNIKIIDFGFVNLFNREEHLNTLCGSPFYASPEMILGKQYIGPEVDMWSLGVILFALLSGHLPFRDPNSTELYRKIANAVYVMPDFFSPELQELIRAMLTVDQTKRIKMDAVKNHPWVNEGYDGPPDNYLPPRPIVTTLDEAIIGRTTSYGFDKENVGHQILLGPRSPAFSVYYMLKEQIERDHSKATLVPRAVSQPSSPTQTKQDMLPIAEVTKEDDKDDEKNDKNDKESVYGSTSSTYESAHSSAQYINYPPPPPEYSNHPVEGPSNHNVGHFVTINRRGSIKGNYKVISPYHPSNQPKEIESAHTLSPNRPFSKPRRRSTVSESGQPSNNSVERLHPYLKTSPRSVSPTTSVTLPRLPSMRSRASSISPAPGTSPVAGSSIANLPASEISKDSPKDSTNTLSRKKSLNGAITRALASASNAVSKFRKDRSSIDSDETKTSSPGGSGLLASLPRRKPSKIAVAPLPRVVKIVFGSDTTSTKPLEDIKGEIERSLLTHAISNTVKNFKYTCATATLELEIEICKLHKTNMHGIILKRIKGSLWEYQNLCQKLVGIWRL